MRTAKNHSTVTAQIPEQIPTIAYAKLHLPIAKTGKNSIKMIAHAMPNLATHVNSLMIWIKLDNQIALAPSSLVSTHAMRNSEENSRKPMDLTAQQSMVEMTMTTAMKTPKLPCSSQVHLLLLPLYLSEHNASLPDVPSPLARFPTRTGRPCHLRHHTATTATSCQHESR